MELKIERVVNNDLVVTFHCTCPNEKFIGTKIENLMKQKVYLYGYNDDNFFDNVNESPRNFKCKCGKEYTEQWFKDGYVEVKEISTK